MASPHQMPISSSNTQILRWSHTLDPSNQKKDVNPDPVRFILPPSDTQHWHKHIAFPNWPLYSTKLNHPAHSLIQDFLASSSYSAAAILHLMQNRVAWRAQAELPWDAIGLRAQREAKAHAEDYWRQIKRQEDSDRDDRLKWERYWQQHTSEWWWDYVRGVLEQGHARMDAEGYTAFPGSRREGNLNGDRDGETDSGILSSFPYSSFSLRSGSEHIANPTAQAANLASTSPGSLAGIRPPKTTDTTGTSQTSIEKMSFRKIKPRKPSFNSGLSFADAVQNVREAMIEARPLTRAEWEILETEIERWVNEQSPISTNPRRRNHCGVGDMQAFSPVSSLNSAEIDMPSTAFNRV